MTRGLRAPGPALRAGSPASAPAEQGSEPAPTVHDARRRIRRDHLHGDVVGARLGIDQGHRHPWYDTVAFEMSYGIANVPTRTPGTATEVPLEPVGWRAGIPGVPSPAGRRAPRRRDET